MPPEPAVAELAKLGLPVPALLVMTLAAMGVSILGRLASRSSDNWSNCDTIFEAFSRAFATFCSCVSLGFSGAFSGSGLGSSRFGGGGGGLSNSA